MKSVLVIEDTRSLADMIAQEIERKYKLPAIVARDYKEAKEKAAKYKENIFLAIVDLSLPDAQDGEAVDLILSHDIPVVVFTGKLDDSIREHLLNKGVSDYVLKNASHSVEYLLHLVYQIHRNRRTKVLVVDDSRMFRRIMCNYLDRQCFQVVEAQTAQEALDILDEHSDIKLAILDCFMEGMDGFELTSEIRKKYSKDDLGIIGVSGKAGNTISARFMKSGANDFIVKPFIAEEFFCRVNLSIDYIENVKALKGANQQKNQLIGMVAHDIRGPLGSIVNIADMISQTDMSPTKVQKMLNLISKNGQEMLNMVNELLDMSVIESGEFELAKANSDFCDLLQEVIGFYREAAVRKGIRIELSMPDSLIAFFDRARMKQVINNMVSNAIKYSPQKSEVKVILSQQDEHVLLQVIDQGPGIKLEEQNRLFGAFQTLSSQTTGGETSTGLGLAICKKMVDAHKGRIGYNRTEQGSEFYFTIPVTS